MSNGHEHHNGDTPPDIPVERIAAYQARAQELLDSHSRSFDEFTLGQRRLVRLGDTKLRATQATGYNILLDAADMPLLTAEPLVFYNNYIGRPEHFGLLLASMEYEGLITEEEIRFGVKATKVVNTGEWEPEPADEMVAPITITSSDGSKLQTQVSKTVETVITFRPRDANHAQDIAAFLVGHTAAGEPQAVSGSWYVPDIRATAPLADALTSSPTFVVVRANVYTPKEQTAQLVVARQRTHFRQRWQRADMIVNETLAVYLASPESGVSP